MVSTIDSIHRNEQAHYYIRFIAIRLVFNVQSLLLMPDFLRHVIWHLDWHRYGNGSLQLTVRFCMPRVR